MRSGHRLSVVIGSVALMLLATSAWARTPPGSGFVGSVHDFSGRLHPNGEPAASACVSCHLESSDTSQIPVPGDMRLPSVVSLTAENSAWPGDPRGHTARSLPLWHDSTIVHAAYAMYQNGPGAPTRGPRASQAIANGMSPGSTSLLCLGCHDGSVAINLYGNTIGGDSFLGNHHPIGFDYEAVRAVDKEIRLADAAPMGTAGVVRDHLYGAGQARMECGTCHSVHNLGNTGESLLWRSDMKSRLCLTCHDKGTNPGIATP